MPGSGFESVGLINRPNVHIKKADCPYCNATTFIVFYYHTFYPYSTATATTATTTSYYLYELLSLLNRDGHYFYSEYTVSTTVNITMLLTPTVTG